MYNPQNRTETYTQWKEININGYGNSIIVSPQSRIVSVFIIIITIIIIFIFFSNPVSSTLRLIRSWRPIHTDLYTYKADRQACVRSIIRVKGGVCKNFIVQELQYFTTATGLQRQ